MTIYVITGYNHTPPVYFDSNATTTAQEDAQALLIQTQNTILEQEKDRFTICATISNGEHTTWCLLEETDDENTICQVFDNTTGQYTEYPNKTEAYAAKEALKQQFLSNLHLDKVYELDEMPTSPTSSVVMPTI